MGPDGKPLPTSNEYYMQIALAVRARANCRGARVGAVLVVSDRVVSTGYNGTPDKMTNCDDGGCERCLKREAYGPGKGYDLCICVHAEQNALLSAARFGISVQGGVIYTTMRPCFGCTKELLQAKILTVYYLHEWKHPDPDVWGEYEKIQARFQGGIKKLQVDDPQQAWAVPSSQGADLESGHTIL
jgi:dCMP deaminase